MPQQQQSAAGFLFFIMILWMIFPDAENRTQSLLLSDLASERLRGFRSALDVLNQTRWGDFAPAKAQPQEGVEENWLNLTGFRKEDRFAWEDFGHFRERGEELSRYAMPAAQGQQLWGTGEDLPVWANASGTVHGDWVKRSVWGPRGWDSYNLSDSVPAMHWFGDNEDWARNITGDTGRMVVVLEGNKTAIQYQNSATDGSPLSGGTIRNIKGTVQIEDSHGSHLSWESRLWGVHWPQKGVIMMTTTSEKFDGIFGLPHLTPGEDYFQSSQMLLNQTLAQTLDAKEEHIFIDQNTPWSSDMENPTYTKHPFPHCEFILYAQILPPARQDIGLTKPDTEKDDLGQLIHNIESELETPLGAPVGNVPPLQMSSIVYSPDCGFFLETKGPPEFPPGEAQHLMGLKREVHLHQVKSWLLVFALVVFLQSLLAKWQLAEAYTPSTMARVSFVTASIMVIADGMTFMAAATWVSSAASTFLPTLVLMFSSFLSMTIGGSFLAKIHEVHRPEWRDRSEERNQSAGTTAPNTVGATPDNTTANTPGGATPTPATAQQNNTGSLLPGPVTAGRPTQTDSNPVIVPSDQDVDAEIAEVADAASAVPQAGAAQGTRPRLTDAQSFQGIIGRYILSSLAVSFLIISSTTWYPFLRSMFLNLCAFLYLSLWVPQIYRNTMRNCRKALQWRFVIGQSILRVLPLAYFWVKEDNFLYAVTEARAFLLLCAWLWLQIVILAAQDIVGPRFVVPTALVPEAWDYHPVLREDNLEAGGLPIGLVGTDHPGLRGDDDETKKSSNTRSIDCAICREMLEVPVINAGEEAGSVASAFARRMYMVTPCRHIFHTACLEGWMRFRLQCPICRDELPPL